MSLRENVTCKVHKSWSRRTSFMNLGVVQRKFVAKLPSIMSMTEILTFYKMGNQAIGCLILGERKVATSHYQLLTLME